MPARQPRKTRRVGRPSGDSAQETQGRILDAAEGAFATVGYSGARTQEIADAAGVTKAMIHYYFESKERLFRAVLDRILFELIKLVQEVTSNDAGRVRQLDIFIKGFFDYVARHPHFGRLTFFVGGRESRYFENSVTGFFRPLFERGVRFIEAGIAEGSFRRVDPAQLLLAVYAVTMEYVADARFISLLLQRDAMSSDLLAARRAALIDMVHRTLGLESA